MQSGDNHWLPVLRDLDPDLAVRLPCRTRLAPAHRSAHCIANAVKPSAYWMLWSCHCMVAPASPWGWVGSPRSGRPDGPTVCSIIPQRLRSRPANQPWQAAYPDVVRPRCQGCICSPVTLRRLRFSSGEEFRALAARTPAGLVSTGHSFLTLPSRLWLSSARKLPSHPCPTECLRSAPLGAAPPTSHS